MASFSGMVSTGLALLLGLFVAPAPLTAQTLPLDEGLTSLNSPAGQQLLQESESLIDYIPLASQFVTQQNQAFCGIASTVMVLNALGIPAPEAPAWDRQYFTQENLFNEATEAVIARSLIERQGLTLAELAAIIGSYAVEVEVLYGGEVTLAEFREAVATNLAEGDNFVVVNYLRRAIAQETGGHISPIAAYDAETDQFLILDVSRYKYPPVWVGAEALWAATNTVDSVSDRTRGIVLVSAVD